MAQGLTTLAYDKLELLVLQLDGILFWGDISRGAWLCCLQRRATTITRPLHIQKGYSCERLVPSAKYKLSSGAHLSADLLFP